MNDLNMPPAGREEKASAAETLLFALVGHKNLIIGALAVLIALGAGAFFWIQRQAAKEKEAAPLLSVAAAAYDRGDFEGAIAGTDEAPGLKTLSEQYDGTPSGEMAELLLANAYFTTGSTREALEAFSRVSLKSPDLKAAALAGKAASESDLGEYAAAAGSFEAASRAAENTALKAQYLTAAGQCRMEAGEAEKAGKLFREVIDRYPASTGAGAAQRSLWRISGTTEENGK